VSSANLTEVRFRVRRFDPAADSRPRWEEFTVHWAPGMTVLDALWRIKEQGAPGLAWRASCRMGICGSCGMFIQGRPRLACNTQVSDLRGGRIDVAPLPNFRIVRDLVPDLGSMFADHAALKPYLIRDDLKEQENPTREYYQSPDEMMRYGQFSYCIKCGCCMAACPTLATDARYLGPMPLAAAERYDKDTRDEGRRDRNQRTGTSHGAFRCHYAGECSRACPKGVDPAKAIQYLKRQLVLDYLHLARRKKPCQKLHGPGQGKPLSNIPAAPAKTV
jgi:succinate dehydrogenase iron-sulfur subunit